MKKYLADRGPAILLFLASFLLVNLYFGFICGTRVKMEDLVYLDVIGELLAVTVWHWITENRAGSAGFSPREPGPTKRDEKLLGTPEV